jgi:hypothetical protein
MFNLQTQLPRLQYFKNCWGCANSEFTPLQRRPYGAMACFRKKPKHFTFRTNAEIIRNWSKLEEIVQELHVCPSFRRRVSKRFELGHPIFPSLCSTVSDAMNHVFVLDLSRLKSTLRLLSDPTQIRVNPRRPPNPTHSPCR